MANSGEERSRAGVEPEYTGGIAIKRLALALTVLVVPLAASAGPAATSPTAVVISITVKQGRPSGGIQRPTVKKGQLVRLIVRSDSGTGVHLHGYDLEKPVRKGKATVIQFTARLAGRFEVELHPADTLLAQLTVRP
jgi:hypothetical protein